MMCWRVLLASTALLVVSLSLQFKMHPLINDISTDLEDPPSFTVAKIGPLPEAFKSQIKSGYPNLKTLEISGKTKAEVYDEVVKTAKGQPSWEVTFEDADAGLLEGVDTTRIFRFKDDFVVRVKGDDGADVAVDMRSRSRVGKGDFGKNAARIEGFFASLKTVIDLDPPGEAS